MLAVSTELSGQEQRNEALYTMLVERLGFSEGFIRYLRQATHKAGVVRILENTFTAVEQAHGRAGRDWELCLLLRCCTCSTGYYRPVEDLHDLNDATSHYPLCPDCRQERGKVDGGWIIPLRQAVHLCEHENGVRRVMRATPENLRLYEQLRQMYAPDAERLTGGSANNWD